MRLHRLLAAAVLAGLVTVTLPAGAGVVPQRFAFSNADVGFSEGAATAGLIRRLGEMDAYAGDRKPVLRLDLDWWSVQPCRACPPDFTALESVVDAARARDLRVLLILDYAPPWANGEHADDKWFPVSDADWRAIVDATVARFDGRVHAYEVWNEPNFGAKGGYGDGSAETRKQRYWELTRIAADRVRAGCPECVVLAGASGAGDPDPADPSRNDNESAAWLAWGYDHGYAGTFDAVTHHPYPAWNSGRAPSYPECDTPRWWAMFGPPDEDCGELAAVHAVMVANGDGAKKIWGTEFGYPSIGTGSTPEQRRDHLEEGVRMWRALDYTGPLFLYSYADSSTCEPGPECHFGLTDAAGAPKQPAHESVRLALTDTFLPTLAPGRSLHRQSALRSADGRFQLWLQGDGNLVLYQGPAILWRKTDLKAIRLTNRHDGSLALVDGAGRVVWSTPTAGQGDSDLTLDDDGGLALYPVATPDRPSWIAED